MSSFLCNNFEKSIQLILLQMYDFAKSIQLILPQMYG